MSMFPVNDLNLAVCGLATIAATVGYAFSRKLATESSLLPAKKDLIDPESKKLPVIHSTESEDMKSFQVGETESHSVSEAATSTTAERSTPIPIRSLSLKRKRPTDEEEVVTDAGYPYNLALIYPPKKRSRTPSSDEAGVKEVAVEQPRETNSGVDTAGREETTVEQPNEKNPSLTTTPPPVESENEATPPPSTPDASSPPPSSPPHVFGLSATIASPIPKTFKPAHNASTSTLFSEFAGTISPFSKIMPPSRSKKPSWMAENKGPNDEIPSSESEYPEGSAESSEPFHVLTAAVPVPKSTVECLTGEENEDVELELKGVRLFIKRGDKPFTGCISGLIKLLSDTRTLDERLLFRREPLWQAAMNVRIHPSVRCTFDAQESVLRVVVKEVVEKPRLAPQDWERELVIYALKPGRTCSKQDFKDFAESLMKSRGLEPKAS